MQPFVTLEGLAAPLDRMNVDTDMIIPKQFLKKIERTGFGQHLFHEMRFLDDHGQKPNPDFVLNSPAYKGAAILVAGENFGCGSSREHAPWALLDYGFQCVIAPSFADIFYNNCFNNGILPVALKADEVRALFAELASGTGVRLKVDLPSQTVSSPAGLRFRFEVDPFNKERLLKGQDSIGWVLQFDDRIRAFEAARGASAPWAQL